MCIWGAHRRVRVLQLDYVEYEPKGHAMTIWSTQIVGVGLATAFSFLYCSLFLLSSHSVVSERKIEMAPCFRRHQGSFLQVIVIVGPVCCSVRGQFVETFKMLPALCTAWSVQWGRLLGGHQQVWLPLHEPWLGNNNLDQEKLLPLETMST